AQSMFVILALNTFIGSWNSYFWEQLLFTQDSVKNLTLIVKESMNKTDKSGNKDVSINMAMAMLSAIPTLAIFAFLQKYLIQGMTFDGLKG
ncbi:MAG: carbohydrate ABC transporter permease, partial [Clostridia bacterium]|nr:carbohydrate ABC transporter permease [Clostridia bacterium]